jgi:rubrerythrin
MKSFDDLTQPEILALAISSEEEDGRIYADFAEGLRENHPDTAQVFSEMAAEQASARRGNFLPPSLLSIDPRAQRDPGTNQSAASK